jgi:hypothetical protein
MNEVQQAKRLGAFALVLATFTGGTAVAVDESGPLKQIAKLRPPYSGDGAPADQFGKSVDLSGDLMIVAVPDDDDVQNPNSVSVTDSGSGSAVIYQRDATDPTLWTRVAKLLPDTHNEQFGFDVAIDGDVAAVSARTSNLGASGAGAVYLFERNAGGPDTWGQVRIVFPADIQSQDNFGWSIDLSGDTLVAGAPDEDELDTSAGAVYVFQRNLGGANNWGEAVKLLPDELRAGLAYDFGTAVAISGDTIAVGAIGDDDAEVNAGAVYVFSRNEGGTDAWGRTGLVDAGGLAQNGLTMGNAVALEGEWLIAGARSRDTAFLFRQEMGNWSFHKELPNEFQGGETNYGDSVAISGDIIAVGDGLSPPNRHGAVALFRQDEGGADQWGFVKDLFASDPVRGLDFGVSLALDGDILVGGAPGDDEHSISAGISGSGAVFIFERDQGGPDAFDETVKVTLEESGAESHFGNTVAVDGSYAVIGAPEAREFGPGSGAAYIYKREDGAWSHLVTLQPTGVDSLDRFGSMVDISGDFAVVQLAGNAFPKKTFVFEKNLGGPDSWGERAVIETETGNGDAAITIDGDTLAVGERGAQNSLGNRTGAARIFQKDAGGIDNWGLVTKVSPTDVTTGVQFGWSVDLSGDRLVVGSRLDDEGGLNTGAAYVFERDQGGVDQWGQVDKLVTSGTETGQEAGATVAISDTIIALGAPRTQTSRGRVYLFEEVAPGDWQEQRVIDSPEPQNQGNFGGFLRLVGQTLAVTDPGYRDPDLSSTAVGAVRIFERDLGGPGNWGQLQLLRAEDRTPGDGLSGWVNSAYTNRGSLGFDGRTVITGAYGSDTLNLDVGAAYIFLDTALFADGFEQALLKPDSP